MRSKSERFSWCVGCGKWEDVTKSSGAHYSMYVPQQEPNERNFEGTPEEMRRFLTARALRFADAIAFEQRIDEELLG